MSAHTTNDPSRLHADADPPPACLGHLTEARSDHSASVLRTSATFDADRAKASGDAVVVVQSLDGQARFTVLGHSLIRLEWQPSGRGFEDRPSFAVIHRTLPVPLFSVQRRDGADEDSAVVITTERIRLVYAPDASGQGSRFSASNLLIERLEPDVADPARWPFAWTPGAPASGNLGGTVRTLDGVSGATDLPGGLLSRDGWALVDDSDTPVFDRLVAYDGKERSWPVARWHLHAEHACVACGTVVKDAGAKHAEVVAEQSSGESVACPHKRHEAASPPSDHSPIDWYFFAHGRDYPAALADFARISGRIPVPPRYALGVWWSRYWAYSDNELKDLVAEFNQHRVPLDVLVIDMDWHLDGWTGYTWNPGYFPEPETFLNWCHQNNLRTTLNLHPADGVGKHERAFHNFAHSMGRNTFHVYRVPFDCTDPRFIDLYFELLHHPIEAQGIDFWWMDWQQGTATTVPGLDPLPWLNHLHWSDMEHGPRSAGNRPLVFSRWGGLGNHRYQVGFSGDTYNDWASLAFQPRFTATAGNVGYAWWSHDIGGHQPGPVEPELYVRWIQFGITSPILRTHASKNPRAERRIWSFPESHFLAAREAFQLRTRLIPYLYSSAHHTHQTTLPLCRPLYLEWPTIDAAYEHPDQYLLGESLLCAPVLEPAGPGTGIAETIVWLPPGRWNHWFSARTYEGPGHIICRSPLDRFPLFIRAGGAVALAQSVLRSSDITGEHLTLRIALPAPGEHRISSLIEDDTLSPGYLHGAFGTTPILVSASADGRTAAIEIGPTAGVHERQPARREWIIELMGVSGVQSVYVDGRELPRLAFAISSNQDNHESIDHEPAFGWSIDDSRGVLHMRLRSVGIRDLSKVQISLIGAADAERASENRLVSSGTISEASAESRKPAAPNASPRRPKGL